MKDQLQQSIIDGNEGVAPVTAANGEEIGADGYGANAGMAVERAKGLG